MRFLRQLAYRARRPVLGLASVGVVVATFVVGEAPVAKPIALPAPAPPTPTPIPVFTPLVMQIPKIAVEGPVVPVGTEADGTMGSPKGAVDVGWWSGRKAGEGNALFAAHVNWNGQVGPFYRLKELLPGDDVIVSSPGMAALTYRVVWVKNYDGGIDATDLLGNELGKQTVTLITCGGQFDTSIGHHVERIVARAELVTV